MHAYISYYYIMYFNANEMKWVYDFWTTYKIHQNVYMLKSRMFYFKDIYILV